ncbi:MAG: hypothetical protein JNJ61_08280 [Anaerolineae bacterium]|nr:hypothetical protein [Anaerolineae bacterium]
MQNSKGEVVELVLFKLNAGVSHEAFMGAVQATQQKIAQFKGFKRRQLLHNDEGQWVDVVWWNSLDEAMQAAESFSTDPELTAFGATLDVSSINMLHLKPVQL